MMMIYMPVRGYWPSLVLFVCHFSSIQERILLDQSIADSYRKSTSMMRTLRFQLCAEITFFFLRVKKKGKKEATVNSMSKFHAVYTDPGY